MNNILIIGAGRSSTALINYVLEQAKNYNWFVTIADADHEAAARKVAGSTNGRATWLDATKVNDRRELIQRADVVVSLLPAHLHLEVAQDCLKLKKHLITASYISKQMYALGDEARERALIFMGEMGLDPGIDHMSGKQKIDQIKAKGGRLKSFRSYTGGLVAPESDNNPWHYKFSWNPRNVVLAGQGTAQFLEDGKLRYVPYNRIFAQTRTIDVPGMGEYEVYVNRDSLLYRELYDLGPIPNLLRGTIRHKGFCKAWDALVKIGLTDASFPILDSEEITYHELLDAYVANAAPGSSVKEKVANLIGESVEGETLKKLDWLGLFSKKKIRMRSATPSLILENLLLEKWKLQEDERDMVIMQHEFEYELARKNYKMTSTMVMKGDDAHSTAMSKLVGLPIGIFVKHVMLGNINSIGVNIPVMKEVYEPVLEELKDYGVVFHEKEELIR
ncbi:MAG: saccharopine dehydrogenase NADP-binding domain-containing protein [Saprospiraceae bacterium]|nr:saccharopine dehydrogenase NADP-binding domain-containing protein [Saprospiraceae bacterium]